MKLKHLLKGLLLAGVLLYSYTLIISFGFNLNKENYELKNDIEQLKTEIEAKQFKIEWWQSKAGYYKELYEISESLNEFDEALRQFKGKYELQTMEITAYAPTCNKAVEGVCYQGDPTITASGERVEIGVTVATPFGTWIWIEGFGWRKVQDRGGLIGENNVDVVVKTQAEALAFGRQERQVLIKR